MSSNVGKVSFSFSKISKKPSFQTQPKETVKKIDKVEYIESIENNSVKVLNADNAEEEKPLIIPLKHPNLLLQSVIDTVKSRVNCDNDSSNTDVEQKTSSPNCDSSENKPTENPLEGDVPIKTETLEEMAAREILEESAKEKAEKSENSNLTVPLTAQIDDKKESTLEDYENIPVTDFGLAMLRGMGWDPKKGIGKNGKIVKVEGPNVRPKGLGLGADKAFITQKPLGKNVSEKDMLGKGSKVRITFGNYKNLYGTVEGFDDYAGRVNVFMAISNERVAINESFVQLVTADEFSKYSKVININAYNNYKEKESDNGSEKIKNKTFDKSESNKNGRLESSDNKESIQKSSSNASHKARKRYESSSESEHWEDNRYSKSTRKRSVSKDRNRSIKTSSTYGDKHLNKYSSDDKSKRYGSSKSTKSDRHRSKSDMKRDKYSKKYSSEDSQSEEEYRNKSRSKHSRRDRSRSLSNSSDNEKRRKHKKSKKKSSR